MDPGALVPHIPKVEPPRCVVCRRPALGAAMLRWLELRPYGAAAGRLGPPEGLELARPALCCSWSCLEMLAHDAQQ